MAVWDSAKRVEVRYSHPWLAAALFALDKFVLRSKSVVEYSAHPACIFRLEITCARQQLTLRDGTQLRQGQRIVKLHFWNEHIPPVPRDGATIGWAHQMHQCIELSLRELARFLASRPDLRDISAICGDAPSATREQTRQFSAIMAHFGFEALAEPEHVTIAERLHRTGENILISLIVFARNAGALRFDTLRRARVPVYISRAALLRQFGDNEQAVLETAESL